jgi:hypothetical protein
MPNSPCPCSRRHSPPITEAECDVHHSPPKTYPLILGAEVVKVRLCANAHRIEHHLLNELRDTGVISAASRRRFPRVLVDMALAAWDKTDVTLPVPRTLA